MEIYNPFMDDKLKGTILCTGCRKKLVSLTCPCGCNTAYIRFYWNGNRYNRRRDKHGKVLTLDTAFSILKQINEAMDTGIFDPVTWLDGSVAGRRFEVLIEQYYEEKDQISVGSEGVSLSKDHLRIIKGYNRTHFVHFHGKDVQDIVSDKKSIKNFAFQKLTGLKLKSRRNVLSALHAFFVWLEDAGIIDTLPKFPEIKGNDSTPRRALTREEQNQILEKIPGEFRNPIEFMFHTGLRAGELCGLRIGDVDLNTRRIWVMRGEKRETTKSGAKLPVPLNDTALQIVRNALENRFPRKDEPLFINPLTGRGYKYKALRNKWLKYSGYGVKSVGLHAAGRHSFCSQIVPLADPLTAQRLMRHADIRSTNTYYHAQDDRLLDIVQRNDNVLPLKKTNEE